MAHASITLKRHVHCPHCGECTRSTIDHLIGPRDQTFGDWHCHCCGRSFRGVVHPDGTAEVEPTDRSIQTPVATLVELPPQKKSVFFVIEHHSWPKPGEKIEADDKEYWIDEHTCPTNWIRDVRTIVSGEDDDPHGLFRHVRTVPMTEATMKDKHRTADPDDLDAIATFPEILGKPTPGSEVIVVLDPWTDPSAPAPFVRLLTKPGRKIEHPVVEGDCVVGNGDLGVLLAEFPHVNQDLVNRITALDRTNEELTTVLLHTVIVSPEGAVLAHGTALSDPAVLGLPMVTNADIVSLTRSISTTVPETASFVDKLRALAGAHVSAAFSKTLLNGATPAESDFADLFAKTGPVVGMSAQIYDADVRAILATFCYNGTEIGFVREMQIFHHGRFH